MTRPRTRSRGSFLRRSVLASVVGVLVLSGAARAQLDGPTGPTLPQAKDVGKPPMIRTFFVLLLLVGLAVGANAMPSKRGHQD